MKRKIIAMVFAVTMVISTSFASLANDVNNLDFETDINIEENVMDNSELIINNENADIMLTEELMLNPNYIQDPTSTQDFSDKLNQVPLKRTLFAATGDKYEYNDGSNVATLGLEGKLVQANIHNATDQDWYQFEVSDLNDPYSFILNGIPTGCDYDLYLIYQNGQGWMSSEAGNSAEQMYTYLPYAGTYYVVVVPYQGFNDNNYTLYFGNHYKTNLIPYKEIGFSYSFGNVPLGNTYNVYSSTYNYNLTNDNTIPNHAILKKFYITGDGNGAYHIGFYKYVNGISQYGGLALLDINYENDYAVKQNFAIYGSVIHSDYFTWTPRVSIEYKYPVILENLRFVSYAN